MDEKPRHRAARRWSWPVVVVLLLVAAGGGALAMTQLTRPGAPSAGSSTTPDRSVTSTPSTTGATPSPGGSRSASVSPSAVGSPRTGASRTPSRTPAPSATLTAAQSFSRLEARLGGRVGIAWIDGAGAHSLGRLSSGPSWSTIKVPLAIAALTTPSTATSGNVSAAIRNSDNGAALALWNQLGAGSAAAGKVDAALRAFGAGGVHTQSRTVHPPYSPYGQTEWSLASQATFARALACTATGGSPAGEVYSQMGRISGDQSWGLGHLSAARFKGGWGPDFSGRYLVRQFGVVTVGGGRYAVAIASAPGSGSFGAGIDDLGELTSWFASTRTGGPGGYRCG